MHFWIILNCLVKAINGSETNQQIFILGLIMTSSSVDIVIDKYGDIKGKCVKLTSEMLEQCIILIISLKQSP